MGSGEFGGGGSVRWQVRYDAHEDNLGGSGRHLRGHGRDKGPRTDIGDTMLVTCSNARIVSVSGDKVILEITLADSKKQVVVKWGDDLPETGRRQR